RTPGSPKLPSVVACVACGFTSGPFSAPHECSICGQSWPDVPGGGEAGGTHSTVYGVTGGAIAPTTIWLSGFAFNALMPATKLAIEVNMPLLVSFDSQLATVSAGGLPVASAGGVSGGAISALGEVLVGSVQRWPNWLQR